MTLYENFLHVVQMPEVYLSGQGMENSMQQLQEIKQATRKSNIIAQQSYICTCTQCHVATTSKLKEMAAQHMAMQNVTAHTCTL